MLDVGDLTAGDVMSRSPLVLPATATIAEAYAVLVGERISGAPVVDEAGKAVGVFSASDLLDELAPILDPEAPARAALIDEIKTRPVGQGLGGEVVGCDEATPLVEACKRMVHNRVHRLVVTEGGTPVGVLSAIDVVRALAAL